MGMAVNAGEVVEVKRLVCLRCEWAFPELDPEAEPPLQCPSCGRAAYWAVQTALSRWVYAPERGTLG